MSDVMFFCLVVWMCPYRMFFLNIPVFNVFVYGWVYLYLGYLMKFWVLNWVGLIAFEMYGCSLVSLHQFISCC